MKCHNVLGISERASEDEIISAYTHKIAEVEQEIDVNPALLEKKRQELNTARKDCLTWRSKPFASRVSSRVSEFSSQVASPTRLNECCIGPFSFCDTCCGTAWKSSYDSCCVDCCGVGCGSNNSISPAVCCDLLLYAGIGISIISGRVKSKAEFEQRQAEEWAAAERERAAKLQSSEQECRSTLHTMLTSLSAESAQNAWTYITGKPKNVSSRDAVNRDFAIKEASQYIASIDSACMRAINNHSFEEATLYLKLLKTINSRDNKYKVLTNSINNVMEFLNAQSPYIVTANYSEINTILLSELRSIQARTSLSIDSHNLQSLVWGMALEDPLDIFSYRTLIDQLSALGMTIDTISSLIYVESKYGKSIIEGVRQSYWNDLCSFISRSSSSSILSLASISAWCGNSNVEVLALGELSTKQNLPDILRERYDLIKNQ